MSNNRAVPDKVRAVAFTIEDKVYAGTATENHITLYMRLLREVPVPADKLDAWMSDEKNHGFVTEQGHFINRTEAFRRFGLTRSQDLKPEAVPTTRNQVMQASGGTW